MNSQFAEVSLARAPLGHEAARSSNTVPTPNVTLRKQRCSLNYPALESWQSTRPSHHSRISQSAVAAIIAETQSMATCAETQSIATCVSTTHSSSIVFHTTPPPSRSESPAAEESVEAADAANGSPKSLLATLRAQWNRSEPQLRTPMATPVEYIHTRGPYTYVHASTAPYDSTNIVWHVKTQRQWRDQYEHYLHAYGIHGAACEIPAPYYVYKDEDGPAPAHRIGEAHVVPLRIGTEIECFGLLEGRWVLTPYIARFHEMRFISKDGPKEWVYVLMRQDDTLQATWLKMPAKTFFPTTFGIKARKTVQKLGQLIAWSIHANNLRSTHPLV
ncbi:hypothetical protein R3P38DRAFT_2801917 [Favolaschia claudopus]|uniref:DUF1990 domain-containing protein n=1 Tax=Favolaschia claudopus TaxID=2862362 RepID=A0AAV9ZV78_9AGAR